MCPKEYLNPPNQQKKSINQGLRRIKDDHQNNVHHQNKKETSTKEPEVIDEDGFTLVTKKNAARGIPPITQQLQANQNAPVMKKKKTRIITMITKKKMKRNNMRVKSRKKKVQKMKMIIMKNQNHKDLDYQRTMSIRHYTN
jgi:hypothetical protein